MKDKVFELNVKLTCLTPDSRQAFEKRFKQFKANIETAVMGNVISIDGGGNSMDMLIRWDETALRNLSGKMTSAFGGSVTPVAEELDDDEVDLEGLIDEAENADPAVR